MSSSSRTEPWYIHAGLYVVIAVLIYILIQVAIIQPTQIVEAEEYYRKESRLRMKNLKEAQVLYEEKYGRFAGSLDSLINFLKTDSSVIKVIEGVDTITNRSTNVFVELTHSDRSDTVFEFTPDSFRYSPKSHTEYILDRDTLIKPDTVINRFGRITRVDTQITIGQRYFIEDPDGYGTVSDLYNDALLNTLSWE